MNGASRPPPFLTAFISNITVTFSKSKILRGVPGVPPVSWPSLLRSRR